jgi:molecular chaperone HscB
MALEKKGVGAPRALCWNCQSESGGEYFCEQCIKIQPLSKEVDYFSCLNLPRALSIDLKDLERRFYDLSRKFHPDYYQQKSEQEKAISLEHSANLNKAYRTLRNPIERAEYLIRLEEGAAKAIPTKAPSDLFEEILELQEILEAYKNGKTSGGPESKKLQEQLEVEQGRLELRKKSLEEEELFNLFKAWDGIYEGNREAKKGPILQGMKDVISQRAYLETVLRDIHDGLTYGKGINE